MLDLETMLRRALARVDARDAALALPYDLPGQICRDLTADGLLHHIVADSVDSAALDRRCAGWWVDRERGQLHLRDGLVRTLVLAGIDSRRHVTARLLLEARLKGVQRIVATDSCGNVVEDAPVEQALLERVDGIDARANIPGFADAFERMYALIGDRLRLPVSAFHPERIALALGSLGPGGAERQGAYTAAGAIEQGGREAFILCNHIEAPADFFRPYVERRGATVLRVADIPPELDQPAFKEIQSEIVNAYGALGFGNVFFEVLRYASLLRAIRPAVVHCWMDYCNALCGTAAELVGVPGVVLSCRSVAPDHFRIFQPYMRPAYRALLARRSPMLLNNSRAGAADYARWLQVPRQDIEVVHNGFEFPQLTDEARARVRTSLGLAQDAPIVGSILRFSEEKRPALLIDMAAEMLRADPAVRFLFYGGGVQLEQMRQKVADLGLQHAVLLPGVTDAAWDVLATMDLFVLASRMEGLPNVLVEAQGVGLPVVTTGVGGMPETYVENETGVTVAEASAPALAAAATRILYDPPLRRRMSQRAQEHARREFGIRRMIDETLSCYDRAVAPPHEPSRKAA